MRNQDIWLLAEQRDGRLKTVSFELITRGLALAAARGCRLRAMVFGRELPDGELNRLIVRGVDLVVAVEAPELEYGDIEAGAAAMLELIGRYRPEVILAAATAAGRTLMPYVAMKARAGLTADCTRLEIEPESGHLLQTRPAIGGNIMATIKCPVCRPQMATVRPRSTRPAPELAGRQGRIVRLGLPAGFSGRTAYLGFTPAGEELGLQDAEKVVVAGRGIRRAENLVLVRELADALGAALGATRDVVDRGWLGYPHQVGLSGKTISPKLYIGVGVSGAIQHLAGMQTAATIVAINRDPDAPIFKVADFGITGDLFAILPLLTARVREGKQPW